MTSKKSRTASKVFALAPPVRFACSKSANDKSDAAVAAILSLGLYGPDYQDQINAANWAKVDDFPFNLITKSVPFSQPLADASDLDATANFIGDDGPARFEWRVWAANSDAEATFDGATGEMLCCTREDDGC